MAAEIKCVFRLEISAEAARSGRGVCSVQGEAFVLRRHRTGGNRGGEARHHFTSPSRQSRCPPATVAAPRRPLHREAAAPYQSARGSGSTAGLNVGGRGMGEAQAARHGLHSLQAQPTPAGATAASWIQAWPDVWVSGDPGVGKRCKGILRGSHGARLAWMAAPGPNDCGQMQSG